MVNNKKQIPFPQANDFAKIETIIFANEGLIKDKKTVGKMLGFISPRQVAYYLDAVEYLGIINSERDYTPFGKRVREKKGAERRIAIAWAIIRQPVFGIVYITEELYETRLVSEDIIEIMKEYLDLESDAVYIRRSQTVRKWVDWIKSQNDVSYTIDIDEDANSMVAETLLI